MKRAAACILPLALALAGCASPRPAPGPPEPLATPWSPAAKPSCPKSGFRMEFSDGEAAMGLRVLGINLINCGRDTYRLNSFPAVTALDEDRAELDIDILDGVLGITTALTGRDGPPKPIVLRRNERATAVLAWRNTYDDVREPPVAVAYLEVATAAGEPTVVLTPDGPLDLGSTGRLGVSPWLAASAETPAPDRPSPAGSAPAPDRPSPAGSEWTRAGRRVSNLVG